MPNKTKTTTKQRNKVKKEKSTIVGLTEKITIKGPGGSKRLVARIDTGATMSSIDNKLASELKLGPVIRTKLVKSAHGNTVRPVMMASLKLAGRDLKSKFTIADRTHMKYRVLIGQNILKKNFLVDCSKK
ncbi:hypothetical protein GF336_02760 [Candidatus Woesearchaeota archaeon]|nr:hypothetical protein [Candidatus Woesearchaeota archaeon]